MRDDYKNKMVSKISERYQDLELRIMQDIVRRIKKAGKITSTADWQINRLMVLGYSSEDIEREIKKALSASYSEMFELYDQVIEWEYVRNKDIYDQINAEYIPFDQNEQLKQITDAIIEQSLEDLENVTNSLGFYLDYGNGNKIITPLSQVYTNYLDAACFDIVTGAFDYNSVLRRVVTQLTNSGLRQVEYSSGRTNRADVAARRAVMTAVSQITGKISEYNAVKLGTEHFEVEWHAGARPTHSVWQGRVWTKEQLYSVCGLGTVTGLLGANCYHTYYPFIKGISERNWTDEWLEKQEQKENEPKEFHGKEYTLYQAKQRQRQMETAMRAQREKVQLLQHGGADQQEVMLQKAKYQAQLNEYAKFSNKMKLEQERERVYLDMRGKIATNTKQQNSMFPSKMIENASKDIAQYKRYKEVLGDAVGSLAKFGQVKYNDAETWKFIQLDYTRQNQLLNHSELKLPNAENVIIPEAKFTKYLFGGAHEGGLAKGRAFSSRLGYSSNNWQELRREIYERASKYPVRFLDNNGYGDRYEQKVIIYGKKGKPANVVIGWMDREDGTTSMSSVYIKEIK
nr:phage minor capsid protein [uncultured Mediterraneibacter sp.]